MKPIFESNLHNDTPLQRVDEIFGIETFGKIKDKIGGAVQDSLRANKFRQQNSRIEKYKTDMANRAAMRRQWELAQKDPNRFVRGNFSKKLGDMEEEFGDRRVNNAFANAEGMDRYANARQQEAQGVSTAYNGFDNNQVSDFNGATRQGGPSGNGGDNRNGGGQTPPNPTTGGGGQTPANPNTQLNDLIERLKSLSPQQLASIASQLPAAETGGNNPPSTPASPDGSANGAGVATAEPSAENAPSEKGAEPPNEATPPNGGATAGGTPAENQAAEASAAPSGQATQSTSQPTASEKKKPQAGQSPAQPVTNSYIPEIKTGFSSLFESEIFS